MNDKPPEPQRFTLIIDVAPGDVPAVTWLRAALKVLLRAYRIRCVTCLPAER
jgi:hypothetical protein